MRLFYFYFFLFINHLSSAQTYQGIVKDSKTNEVIPNVTIYFANSSSGTMSNMDGTFTLTKPEGLNTALIFRAFSYEILNIYDFENTNLGTVFLKPKLEELSVVKIEGDPWSRSKKEKLFLDYFLGTSPYSKNIKITNLDKINLRFIPSESIMVANSDVPLIINHPKLGYEIIYDLLEFQIDFEVDWSVSTTNSSKNYEQSIYQPKSCYFEGSSFYNDLLDESDDKDTISKKRKKLYKSSLFFLFKSIATDSLEQNNFKLRYDGKIIDSNDEIEVYNDEDLIYIEFDNSEYVIQGFRKERSTITLFENELIFDKYFNNLTPRKIRVSGFMSTLGLGGQLPADFKPN